MTKTIAAAVLLLIVVTACGGGRAAAAKTAALESRATELEQRVARLDADLKETQRAMVQHQQMIQTLNERLKVAEVGMDKLAYGAAR